LPLFKSATRKACLAARRRSKGVLSPGEYSAPPPISIWRGTQGVGPELGFHARARTLFSPADSIPNDPSGMVITRKSVIMKRRADAGYAYGVAGRNVWARTLNMCQLWLRPASGVDQNNA
jgi:hypothetical protein